jgi:hypothetical protein
MTQETDMPERKFVVIDSQTGKEPDLEQIALKEEWAKNLMYCDMEGFVLDGEGNLFLLDECGNYAAAPEGRFAVVPFASRESALRARLEKAEGLLKSVFYQCSPAHSDYSISRGLLDGINTFLTTQGE